MKIRVTKGSGWYEDKVGEVFEVTCRHKTWDAYYVVVFNEYSGNWESTTHWVRDGMYEIVSEDSTPEPSPQLAGIHDSLATLALQVAELKRKVEEQSQEVDSVYEELNGKIAHLEWDATGGLTPLQLAILNAKDTPADVKLALIVEAGRLEEQRKATLREAE
jgi:hypothetical protein